MKHLLMLFSVVMFVGSLSALPLDELHKKDGSLINKTKKSTQLNKHVNKVRSFFYTYYDSQDLFEVYKVKKKLNKYFYKLPQEVKDSIKSFVYKDIEQYLMLNQKDLVLRKITEYLLLFPKDQKNGILLNIVGHIYAERGNWRMLEEVINDLSTFAELANQDWNKEINWLEDECAKIAVSESFDREIEGIWVSDSISKAANVPYYIFQIQRDGSAYLLGGSAFYEKELKKLPDYLKNIFYKSLRSDLNIDNEELYLQFASEHVNQGSEEIAQIGHDAVRRVNGEVAGLVQKKNVSTGTKIGATVASGALGILGNLAASEAAVTKKYIYTLDVNMTKVDENCMDATITLAELYGRSDLPDLYKQDIDKSEVRLYKVNSTDDIIFMSKKGKPMKFFISSVYDESDIESLLKLTKKYKLSRPQFLIPYIVTFPIWNWFIYPIKNGVKAKVLRKHNRAMFTKLQSSRCSNLNNDGIIE